VLVDGGDLYHVWTLSNGKWIDAVEPISIYPTCQTYEEDYWPIKKDPKRKGFTIITYSDSNYDAEGCLLGFVLKSKSVKVNPHCSTIRPKASKKQKRSYIR
jgi:hypothetical protein